MKASLRLSSMDKVFFYPSGPGPYTAISFPLPGDTNGDGLIEMDATGTNILWLSTVVYHVWTGTPSRLLKTVFNPRDNTLVATQRQAQLASVVLNGNGSNTYESAGAKTKIVFQNLFILSIGGKGAVYDAYAPNLQWDPAVPLGSAMLTNGLHDFKFAVIGKNPLSTGYKIGLDSLVVSP